MSNDGSMYEWSVLSNELETGYCGTCCCIKWQCALFLHHITLINYDLYLFVVFNLSINITITITCVVIYGT